MKIIELKQRQRLRHQETGEILQVSKRQRPTPRVCLVNPSTHKVVSVLSFVSGFASDQQQLHKDIAVFGLECV